MRSIFSKITNDSSSAAVESNQEEVAGDNSDSTESIGLENEEQPDEQDDEKPIIEEVETRHVQDSQESSEVKNFEVTPVSSSTDKEAS